MNLKDSVVLITGANRGLGRALVDASLSAGAKRVYATARDPRSLSTLGERVVPLSLDVTDERSLAAAVEQAPDVSLLINNAGIIGSYGVLSTSPSELSAALSVNVLGLLSTTRGFLPALERAAKRGDAAIVNLLSVVSWASMPALGGYSAAKAAAASVTQALRSELAARKVKVHGVYAGALDTDMSRELPIAKTSPADAALGIIQGIEQDQEDIFPDPMSRALAQIWQRDPKQLERQLAGGAPA